MSWREDFPELRRMQMGMSARSPRAQAIVKGVRENVHICPKPDCGAEVMDEMFACKAHWFELPRPIRDEIWRAYRRHGVGSEELSMAHQAAEDFWDQQPKQEKLV